MYDATYAFRKTPAAGYVKENAKQSRIETNMYSKTDTVEEGNFGSAEEFTDSVCLPN